MERAEGVAAIRVINQLKFQRRIPLRRSSNIRVVNDVETVFTVYDNRGKGAQTGQSISLKGLASLGLRLTI